MSPHKTAYATARTLPGKTGRWLRTLAGGRRVDLPLRAERAGLLVVDLQDFFLDPRSPAHLPAAPAVLSNAERLVRAFRERSRPVFFTRHAHRDPSRDGGMMTVWWRQVCRDGSRGSKLPSCLGARPREVLRKCRYTAFSNPGLEGRLRRAGVSDLVVAGVATNLCVESTVRDAFDRGFRTFVPADATAAHNEDYHLAGLRSLAQGFSVVSRTADILESLR